MLYYIREAGMGATIGELFLAASFEDEIDDLKARIAVLEARVKELEGDNEVLRLQVAAKRST